MSKNPLNDFPKNEGLTPPERARKAIDDLKAALTFDHDDGCGCFVDRDCDCWVRWVRSAIATLEPIALRPVTP